MKNFQRWLSGAVLLVLGALACANLAEADKRRQEAKTVGKYHVKLTDDVDIQGTCKFVQYIEPAYDPIKIPTKAEFEDYLRVEAVLLGADTVLVRRNVGEAYLCGPMPLNADGTPKAGYAPLAPAQVTPINPR